ncbi:PIN domain-containing protein [Nocardia yunnanensis]|uniref:Ribonuclease VapC n=1 Tax=Nocardia yunnanensis TaxID=2382165 RepID=A0A386ZCX7_9NOCA|nr:type II toxin-antitoxin system VapC family toxin [Nocardia yunnanensis]AYF74974.1 PIN domain-containing protein [Nocardia yunnanensis]
MIVVDAATWVRALIDSGPSGAAARQALTADSDWAAPAHMPVEVLRTIRKYEFSQLLSREQAQKFAEQMWAAEVRYSHPAPWLLAAIWRYRHTVSPYDAAYLALALRHDAPLVTLDLRLEKAASALGARTIVPSP